MNFRTSIRNNPTSGHTTFAELLSHFSEHTVWDPKDLKEFLADIAPWIPEGWFIEGRLMVSEDEIRVLIEETPETQLTTGPKKGKK